MPVYKGVQSRDVYFKVGIKQENQSKKQKTNYFFT